MFKRPLCYINFFFLLIFFFSCKEKKLLFTPLTGEATGIEETKMEKQTDSFNIITYPYFACGSGIAVGDINNDKLEDIFFTGRQKGGNKLYINKGNFSFQNITESSGIKGQSDLCTGVTMVDINADGWLDIYVSTVSISGQLNSSNELYINNKNGTFTESAVEYGLDFKGHTTQAAFFDYDNDGDLDCFLLNHAIKYTDDFADISSRKNIDPESGDKLFKNNDGKFTDITEEAGIYSSNNCYGLGIAIGDLNNDGWPDIYVSNDFKENDYCYINNGNGTFSEKCNNLFGHTSRFSMGNDMADYNNDGWLDVISLDMLSPDEKILKASVADDDLGIYNYKHGFGFHFQNSKNCLQQNVDGQYFSDVSLQNNVAATDWSWAPLFADFDNDGFKDLYISNGYKYRPNTLDYINFFSESVSGKIQKNEIVSNQELISKIPDGAIADYFYLNKKDGFTNVSAAAGFTAATLSNGAAYADLDNDGRLDLIVNRVGEPAVIYKNNMPVKNYLNVALKGNNKNTFGIGASIYVYTKGGFQLYQQSLSRGFMSSVSPIIHIGLGDNKTIDSLIVLWPGGSGQKLSNLKANSTMGLLQQNATANFTRPVIKKSIDSSWKDITTPAGINFIHKEDAFDDLDVQPLLPHSLASQGPGIAVADVNGDGLEDFFVCGAKGQAGQLWLQTPQSTFIQSSQNCFSADSMYEENNALFFDANGDKFPDLYVVSGGNEFFGSNPLLNDRLYINNGSGGFVVSNSLPALFENKSCVAACDFDKDGDMDLFVGGRANARMYGYNPASVLLVNDGKARLNPARMTRSDGDKAGQGNFKEATEKFSTGLEHIGMVTSACWSDIDGDGWQDLIVAGEWMPITVFKNNKGKLEKQEQPALQKSSGWWNCICKADLDGDGDEDFLVGNWGTNCKLTASEANPLKMYLSDWDNNNNADPILAVYKNGGYYSFLGKADLEKRLPYLKKKFLHYSDIAGKTAEELFGKEAIGKAKELSAYTLESSILWNNNGQLSLQSLPSFLQVSPIFSFASFSNSKGEKNYIAGGNFYDVLPYEGRYDAMLPTLFSVQKNKTISNAGYIMKKGAVRNITEIKIKNQPALLLAKNNERLVLVSKK